MRGGASAPSVDPCVAFRTFVRRARTLVPSDRAAPDDFRKFVDRATPLVVEDVRSRIEARCVRVEALARTIIRHDLIEVAGFCGREVAYSELLRWLVAPEAHPASALRRQRLLLEQIARGDRRFDASQLRAAAEPTTSYHITGFGIADLVLLTPDIAVVVEAKTGTEEHETPAGTFQTVAYEDGLRACLRLPERAPIAIALLAPELRVPQNPRAVPITFVQLCGAFAEALPSFHLDDETTWAFRCALTHLVVHAAPRTARHMRAGLRAATRYLDAPTDAERASVARQNIDVLIELSGALEEAS